jgi:excisionase family DNA binding protein
MTRTTEPNRPTDPTNHPGRPDRFTRVSMIYRKEPAPMEQLLYTTTETAELLHVSRSKVYDLLRMQVLPSVKIGRLRRIPADALRRYLDGLADQEAC